jgi:hypothetical protein
MKVIHIQQSTPDPTLRLKQESQLQTIQSLEMLIFQFVIILTLIQIESMKVISIEENIAHLRFQPTQEE